jgi:hypothetical protein
MVAMLLKEKGIYGNQNTKVQNQNNNSFLDFFDANPNKEGFQLFNTNPNRNAQSVQTVNQSPTGIVNPNQQTLLSNEEIIEQNTGGILSPSAPAKEGGYTYNFSQPNQRTTPYSVFTTPQSNTNANAGVNQNFVRPTLPASEGSYTHGYGLGTPSADTNKDGTPKKKSFIDILKDFTQTDFALDMAMKGLEASAPKVGTPTSTGRTLFEAYNYAKQQKQQKIDNEINRQKAKTDNYREPVYRALVRDKKGNQYGLFSSGGMLYADINGVRVPQQDLQSVIGDYDIRNVGDQMDGVMSFANFKKLRNTLNDDEVSLKKMISFLKEQDKTSVGYQRIIDGFMGKMKTFFSTKAKQYEMTEEELALAIAQGKLQGLLGSSRKEVVGGGVLTEQDARRIIEYLGGDINALQNKFRVQEAISYIFGEKLTNYDLNLEDYNIAVENEYGTRGYKSKDRIEFSPEEVDLLSADVAFESGMKSFDDMTLDQLLNDIDPTTLDDNDLSIYLEAVKKKQEKK